MAVYKGDDSEGKEESAELELEIEEDAGMHTGININYLRSYYIAAKTGNLSKAVQRLMISRPLLENHVKHLEESVGVRLMVWEGDSIRLTRSGLTVFRAVSKAFHEIRQIDSLFERISSRKGEELHIGCPEKLGSCFVPKLIEDFRNKYPHIRTIVNSGTDTAMVKSVEEGGNDLAVIRFKPKNCRLKMKALGKEGLVLIVAPWSRHAPGKEIAVGDLARMPLILPRNGSAVREVILDYLLKFEVGPQVIFESSNTALIKELVMRDNGVTFIERHLVEAELNRRFLREVRITEGLPAIALSIGYPSRSRLVSRPARAFLKLMMQAAREIRSAGKAVLGAEIATPLPALTGFPLCEKSVQRGVAYYQAAGERG